MAEGVNGMIRDGAEAKVSRKNSRLVKSRIPKRYRVRELDERIRRERTRAEARLISEARRAGVATPVIYDIYNSTIEMDYIEGKPLKYVISEDLCEKLGELVGRLHAAGIIHGDLTTSNIIWDGSRMWLIDFGLAFSAEDLESRGVDIHVLFQTLESSHPNHEALIDAFCRGYYRTLESAEDVLERVVEIETRGRYA